MEEESKKGRDLTSNFLGIICAPRYTPFPLRQLSKFNSIWAVGKVGLTWARITLKILFVSLNLLNL